MDDFRKHAELTDHNILLAIQNLMDGKEWSPETLEQIAEILRINGYEVRDVGSAYRWVEKPADDELGCDNCGKDVKAAGAWVADVPGFGAAGVKVLCDECLKAETAEVLSK